MGDVLGMVKRSFATVRAALTEQRGKVDDMARQIAAGMSKVDRLAVLLEQSLTAHVADRATLESLRKRGDEIMERLSAADPSQAPAVQPQEEEEEDSFAWVDDLRTELLAMLKDDFNHAKSAWDVYKPMEAHYAALVLLVMEAQVVSSEEADEKLLMHMPARKRRGSKAPSTVVVYRYIKRAVSHFYENSGKAAVKAFISSINDSTGMGKQVPFKESNTRTVLTLSPSEARHLAEGDRCITEAYCHEALLKALANMVATIGASDLFEEPTPGSEEPTMVCLLAHMAFVVTKVREHLKLRGGEGAGATIQGNSQAGINEGHREPWIRELVRLDGVYWRLAAARNRLRLVDATSSTRASPARPAPPAPVEAATVHDNGGAAASDLPDGDGDGYAAMVVQGGGTLELVD